MKASKRTETAKKAAVAYYRVSTREQGTSGLGLDAQKSAVERFTDAHGYRIVADYRDVESGRHNSRPGLGAAIARAKAEGAELLIAKLDRLSRNAAFILALRDSGARFTACDMPEANTLTVTIMAALAQQEAELISGRTRAALAVLKARGVKLGTDNLSDAARRKSAEAKRAGALLFHNGNIRHAMNYRSAGWTLRAIAEELTAAGEVTRHGKQFTPTTVARLLKLGETAGITARPVRKAGKSTRARTQEERDAANIGQALAKGLAARKAGKV